MIHTFADLCTAIYVVVDDWYLTLPQRPARPGPVPRCSDAELITLSIAAELLGLDAETRFLDYLMRNHPSLFPHLLERSRYNRRRRTLAEATNTARHHVLRWLLHQLPPQDTRLCMIDSVPVPVVGFHHAADEHAWASSADYGYCASKRQHLYGFKLHLLTTVDGLIIDFTLAAANLTDGTFTAQLLEDKRKLTVLGDKGYINAPLQADLLARREVELLTPLRANQRKTQHAGLTKMLSHLRQKIETVNSQLVGHFGIQRNQAKSLVGLCTRLQAKLAAHTFGVYLNFIHGKPLLALKDLALI
jgi:Transposase DDE domain